MFSLNIVHFLRVFIVMLNCHYCYLRVFRVIFCFLADVRANERANEQMNGRTDEHTHNERTNGIRSIVR